MKNNERIIHDKLEHTQDKADKQIQSKKLAGGCCGCLVIICLIAGIIGSCQLRRNFFITPAMSDKEIEKISTNVEHLDSAAEAAKKYVLEVLLAPASAQFPDVNTVWVEDNKYQVTIDVDSHNYFGVMIRNIYIVELEFADDGNWRLIKLTQIK